MKPLQLFGLGNEENRSYFIFEKSNLFGIYFTEILAKLNIPSRIYDKNYDKELDSIEERKNETDNFKNEEFDIDIIYTSDRIIVLVRSNPSGLAQFKSLIFAYAKLIE